MELAARHLQEQLQKQAVGDEATLRAAAERSLSRSPIDVMALPRAEFAGDVPEPREADVIAEYRTHEGRYHRPGRAVLSTVRVPGTPADGAGARARADSALARIRAGATFDEIGVAFGGVRGNQVVLENNFPGSWRGSPRIQQTVFAQRPRAVLAEPVPSTSGWLLVRIDEITASGPVPLREAARDIRQALRREQRMQHEQRRLHALYESMLGELTRPARRVRYAVVEPGRLRIPEPTPQDIDRFYRGHQADYARYDPGSGGLLVRGLDEVRDEVRGRWSQERRDLAARTLADRIETSWRRGARDRAAESEAGGVREAGPVVAGAPVDTTEAGRVLGDSLSAPPVPGIIGVAPMAGGLVVYHVYEVVPRFTPPFEQMLPELAARVQAEERNRDEEAARALFQRDPKRFAVGTAVTYSRLIVTLPEAIDVPLTRAEVERFYRDHFDRYGAAEQVRARHILVSPAGPGPEADRAARARAEELLRRARTGEDFAALAQQYSDDVATKQDGGDLGYFGRGVMLDEIERAAFALKPGEVSGVVKTSEGYHILREMDRLPLQAEPLKLIYANVGWDAAVEKGERMARGTADSLLQVLRTPQQARAAAKKLGLEIETAQHMVGERIGVAQTQAIAERLERLEPGQFYPGVEMIRGQGAVVQWVDRIGPPTLRSWGESSRLVLAVYRRDAGRRAVESKVAELDSLGRAGWTPDTVAALWGGWKRIDEYTRGKGLEGYGGAAEMDSLVFGTTGTAPLEPGRLSGWVDLPDAVVRVRPGERGRPTAAQIAQRVESDRRLLLEYRLLDEFKAMKQRYPVRIQDEALRDVALPPLPPAPVL